MSAIDCYDQVEDVSRFRAEAMDGTFVDCFVCGSGTRSKYGDQHEISWDSTSTWEGVYLDFFLSKRNAFNDSCSLCLVWLDILVELFL